MLAGVIWAIANPDRGVVEPDDLPYDEMLARAGPTWASVVGVYTDWTPLAGRGWLFPEDVDRDDPWQFENFRVSSLPKPRSPPPGAQPRAARREPGEPCPAAGSRRSRCGALPHSCFSRASRPQPVR